MERYNSLATEGLSSTSFACFFHHLGIARITAKAPDFINPDSTLNTSGMSEDQSPKIVLRDWNPEEALEAEVERLRTTANETIDGVRSEIQLGEDALRQYESFFAQASETARKNSEELPDMIQEYEQGPNETSLQSLQALRSETAGHLTTLLMARKDLGVETGFSRAFRLAGVDSAVNAIESRDRDPGRLGRDYLDVKNANDRLEQRSRALRDRVTRFLFSGLFRRPSI